MDFFKIISIENALNEILKRVENKKRETETINILQAENRICCEDVFSQENLPQFNRSTVDGYAVKSSETQGACESIPAIFTLKGEMRIDEQSQFLINNGECVYVPTGGEVPNGSDSMVKIEETEKMDKDTLLIYKPSLKNENIISIGDDIKAGDAIIAKGKKITIQDIAMLCSVGIAEINVYKKPVFTVISTGDEIVDIKEKLNKNEIRDINGNILALLIQKMGGTIYKKILVKDNMSDIKEAIFIGIKNGDFVVLSGGSSVGAADFTKEAINSFNGEGVFIHGLAIKPGKPTIVANVSEKIIFGLPGHPLSAIIVFKVLIEKFYEKYFKAENGEDFLDAEIESNIHSTPGMDTYQPVKLYYENRRTIATPFYGKSGMITLFSKSNGIIRIGSEKEGILKGEKVRVIKI